MKSLLALSSILLTGLLGAASVLPDSGARTATGTAAAQQLPPELEQIINSQGWEDDRWSVMVVSLDAGDTLFAHNPDATLAPASNLKLFTTAAGLHYLGPDYRYSTYVTAIGPVRDGVLEGDLLVYGTGDQTLSGRFYESRTAVWEALADSLQALGIRRITGDIIGDASYFEGPGFGSGWDSAYITHTYAASASALSFNDNVVTLRVSPADDGQGPPQVLLVPGGDVLIRNTARTMSSGGTRIEVDRDAFDGPILLSGRIQPGASEVWRAVPVADPARFAVSMLTEILRERGIQIGGDIRSINDPAASPITGQRVFAPAFEEDGPMQVLAVHRSPPLIQILEVINQRSHNLYADQVLRTVGRVATGHGTVEGGEAAVHALMKGAGPTAASVQMDDGSGLSTLNRASARAFVELLAFMQQSPYWEAYRQTLPEAAVSRGLRRMQETAAAGNLRAKTGTIDEVSALSGYVTAANGEELAFSIISNNVPSTWTAKRIEDRIGGALASFSRPIPTGRRLAGGDRAAESGRTAAGANDSTATAPRVASSGEAPTAEAGADEAPGQPADAAAAAPAAEQPASAASEYEIRRGDTLDGIARRHGISLSDLQQANPGLNPRRLMPGESITIPGG